jgi:hypothetical protein
MLVSVQVTPQSRVILEKIRVAVLFVNKLPPPLKYENFIRGLTKDRKLTLR